MEQLSHIPVADHTLRYVINIPDSASNNSCPSIDELIDYRIGRFAPDSEKYRQVKKHLDIGCKPCAEELAVLGKAV